MQGLRVAITKTEERLLATALTRLEGTVVEVDEERAKGLAEVAEEGARQGAR
jgi:hypothetical protein